jgi:hypothetical protein
MYSRFLIVFALFASLFSRGVGERAKCGARKWAKFKDGVDVHDAALAIAMRGKYASSILGFRRACELLPSNARFWSDLGVTLLRMGHLRSAEACFQASLALDPAVARGNLDETQAALRARGEVPHTAPPSRALPATWADVAMDEAAAAARAACDDLDGVGGDEDDDDDDAASAALSAAVAPTRRMPRLAPPLDDGSYAAFKRACGIEHSVRRLPRVKLADLHAPTNRHYAAGLAPYILTHSAPAHSSALARAGDAGVLISGPFANLTADFYPEGMSEAGVHPYLVPFAAAVAELMEPSGAYPPPKGPRGGAYLHLNFDFYEWRRYLDALAPWQVPLPLDSPDAWLLGVFGGPLAGDFQIGTHWRMLLLGTEGAGMFAHQDRLKSASYQLQVAGVKTWVLCAPEESPHLSVDFDHFAPDYRRFPAARAASCYLDAVEPGDVIFYPADYWHQTLNTPANPAQLSAAITDTLVDANNYKLVEKGLYEKCAEANTNNMNIRHGLTQAVCKELPKLAEWWEAAYGAKVDDL